MAIISPSHPSGWSFLRSETPNNPWVSHGKGNSETIPIVLVRCVRSNNDVNATTCSIRETNPSFRETSRREITDSSAAQKAPHAHKERRKIVKTAWEKIVRWSRSWRLLNSRRAMDVLQNTNKVAVLGGGSFATAMAALVAQNKAEMEVSMLIRDDAVCNSINETKFNSKYLPQHKLPKNVMATTDARAALQGADFCIHAVPVQMGAKATTLTGLSGTGDIMLTCFVKLSRNRTVGVRLGSGEKLDDILASMNQVAEGVATAGAVIALAQKYHVKMPVLTAVARIIDNELTPKKAVLELMNLPQVEEV